MDHSAERMVITVLMSLHHHALSLVSGLSIAAQNFSSWHFITHCDKMKIKLLIEIFQSMLRTDSHFLFCFLNFQMIYHCKVEV